MTTRSTCSASTASAASSARSAPAFWSIPALGGVGITDYTNITGNNAGTYDFVTQMISQGKAVGATLLWSGIGSAILYKFVDVIIGLRPTVEAEREGLDITDHGERAYNM